MNLSLSDCIIYQDTETLRHYLKQQPDTILDEIDEYGYTPLIQTAIVNSPEKARLLLQAGAKPNFTDLTGRSALHWVAENRNKEFCTLLLNQGANPNAYTRAGQSILVMPYLHNYDDIKHLLYQYKADLSFAQDFINAKLLGHRFELEGRVDIVDANGMFIEVEFEGFYHEFSIALLLRSLIDFRYNFAGKHLRTYFPYVDLLLQALQNAEELLKYQHYLINQTHYQTRIDEILDAPLLILPVVYDGHAIALIKYDDWVVRCDRGAYGRDNGTIIFYKMSSPSSFNKRMMKFLLYTRQHRAFIDEAMAKHFQWQPVMSLAMPPQITGNCAWANMEALIPACLYLFLSEKTSLYRKNLPSAEAEKIAWQFFHEWQQWDRDRALHFCLESFASANPARKAAKAAILAAILFQQCEYEKPKDQIKAEKMLPILTHPDYDYILKSYLRVFSQDPNNTHFKNLKAFLDDYGVNFA